MCLGTFFYENTFYYIMTKNGDKFKFSFICVLGFMKIRYNFLLKVVIKK